MGVVKQPYTTRHLWLRDLTAFGMRETSAWFSTTHPPKFYVACHMHHKCYTGYLVKLRVLCLSALHCISIWNIGKYRLTFSINIQSPRSMITILSFTSALLWSWSQARSGDAFTTTPVTCGEKFAVLMLCLSFILNLKLVYAVEHFFLIHCIFTFTMAPKKYLQETMALIREAHDVLNFPHRQNSFGWGHFS